MTTDRPYSKAMTYDAALARLRFLAGKKFDPVCVTGMEKAGAAVVHVNGKPSGLLTRQDVLTFLAAST